MTSAARLRPTLAPRAVPLLVTTVLTTVAIVLVTWPLAREMGSATLRDGEVLLTAWQLNSFHHAFLSDPRTWVDANIFFPYDRAATFNDLLLTHALVSLPAAWARSPVLALNIALLGGIVLCAVFAYLLSVELADSPWASMVAATLFALAPFRFLHFGHVSIAAAWAVPFFFWALLRHLRAPSWSRAALAGIAGVAVGLSSVYHAAFVAPMVPLVLLVGLRRGPGGRQVWLPLLATGLPCLALLISFLLPYARSLSSFGVAAAPDDLIRFGADLSSLGQKPEFLNAAASDAGINPEAHLYPGAALVWLSAAVALVAAASVRKWQGGWRRVGVAVLALVCISGLGLVLPLQGWWRDVWALSVLTLIWVGPVAAMAWAVAGTHAASAAGPLVAIRLGAAGAALSFALALGPEARYLNEAIGPAPYWLLANASRAFEGTRVPARFGGITILFLSLVAAGALAALARGSKGSRLASIGVACVALVACFSELPLPKFPRGLNLVEQRAPRHPMYLWLAEQPGPLAILELPDWRSNAGVDYRYRDWRALRYMRASKQHGHHLVNGTGRIEPMLWTRFRTLEHWSDDFFAFITAYFPVDYVLVHDGGVPPPSREPLRARLLAGTDGWREVFSSTGVSAYAIDRSFGRGTQVDRLLLRRDIAPRAEVVFSARAAHVAGPANGNSGEPSTTLDLMRDGELLETWALDDAWRDFRITVPVAAVAPDIGDGWPRTTTLLRWRVRGGGGGAFEIRGLTVERSAEPLG